MNKPNFSIDDIDAFIFDFDGVLTNNKVSVNQYGEEWVSCSRSDGLGFNVLKILNKPTYILSTEKNPVVTARANKLKLPVIQGVSNKLKELDLLITSKNYKWNKVFYIGNDLNDYLVMKKCGFTACPRDSHHLIKEIADYTLETKGGHGVVCELLEKIIQLNILKILYPGGT